MLIGDYIILYQYKGQREQMCRFDCGQLYQKYEKDSWEAVWEQILSSIDSSRKFYGTGNYRSDRKNEYDLLKDKLFIRPLNFNVELPPLAVGGQNIQPDRAVDKILHKDLGMYIQHDQGRHTHHNAQDQLNSRQVPLKAFW